MNMNIELPCNNCVRDVYRAIGEFLAEDMWASCIVGVDVYIADGEIGACIEWDVHPCREQIAFFRQVWREETNPSLGDIVILHDAPSSIVDDPRELPSRRRASR